VAPDVDFNPRQRSNQNNPLIEMDELANDDELLDELDDEDFDFEHLRR